MTPAPMEAGWMPEALVLGKGPSASRREEIFRRFPSIILVTLNHAIRWADKRKNVWAHFVDYEAYYDSLPHIWKATHLLLPRVMNIKQHRMSQQDRLRYSIPQAPPVLFYDRDEAGLKFFSVEGAVGALGLRGVRRVLLCGVDGGTGYAPGLEDVAHTHLENGRESYDAQWGQLEAIAKKLRMEVRRAPVEC